MPHKDPSKLKQYLKDWHLKNKARRNRRAKQRYTDTKDYVKDKYLQHEFGISLEDYIDLLAKQNGVCAICFEPERVIWKGKLRQLAVDHDHKTGKVRGLLCLSCNTALGHLKEDPVRIHSLLAYLERHRG